MISKKVAGPKRTSLPRTCDHTKDFIADWERHSGTARSDLQRAKAAMLLLIANDAALPAEFRDHQLKGEWRDFRECHIHGDFLLIYRILGKGRGGTVIFTRLGSHSELFG